MCFTFQTILETQVQLLGFRGLLATKRTFFNSLDRFFQILDIRLVLADQLLDLLVVGLSLELPEQAGEVLLLHLQAAPEGVQEGVLGSRLPPNNGYLVSLVLVCFTSLSCT